MAGVPVLSRIMLAGRVLQAVTETRQKGQDRVYGIRYHQPARLGRSIPHIRFELWIRGYENMAGHAVIYVTTVCDWRKYNWRVDI